MPSGPEVPSFVLSVSATLSQHLASLGKRAQKAGKWTEFRDIWPKIIRELQSRPDQFGDPCFRLHELGLDVHHRAIGPVYIVYAIDLTRKIVYLKSIMPIPFDSY